jgi:hypothetical protein
MGLRCSCGVRSTPSTSTIDTINMTFADNVTRSGNLTINVDACVDRLDFSTFSATFTDTSGVIPPRNFTFTATDFDTVICFQENGSCQVITSGMGLVSGETTPRRFSLTFRNNPSPTADQLITFVILGFVSNSTTPNLAPDLTFFGCPTFL